MTSAVLYTTGKHHESAIVVFVSNGVESGILPTDTVTIMIMLRRTASAILRHCLTKDTTIVINLL